MVNLGHAHETQLQTDVTNDLSSLEQKMLLFLALYWPLYHR